MKSAPFKTLLALVAFTAVAFVLMAEQPQAVLGKINFAALFDAAPAMPVTTVEAGKRTYGATMNDSMPITNLDPFYAAYEKRIAAAREVIKGAVESRPENQEAIAKRSAAQANESPLIARMGGVDKMSQMSDEELQAAAAQAAGSYQQSLSGGPPPQGGGMQAMMAKLMSDPEYQKRFEKMSKKEQEAELQKYMGKTPPPPSGPTAAERRAEQATNETAAVVARQKEGGAILKRIAEIDTEFEKKEHAIKTAPGTHEEITRQASAKIAKLPIIGQGEMGPYADPVKVRAIEVERVTLDRNRAALELQQRTALYADRKAKYKDAAAAYTAWLKQEVSTTDATAKLLNDATADVALHCEQDLITLAANLRKYNQEATLDAAVYEQQYQKKMSEK